ncbi:prion-like-(Q/N-rich) domain-bearing protein 25 [Neocloeon triangulifer]|uniref:prion-like-(Q/N-rich) domain-bearing protein 25 n=1 Tax=Neocloeon triangulifer TaxID=2078957 RepID=UPI00286F0A17|nr:prion-like-(Q/N-rich) domain-bearing protein 25 [Neocloeon triangulifer]
MSLTMKLLALLFLASSTLAALNEPCAQSDPDPCAASDPNSECAPLETDPTQFVCQCLPRFAANSEDPAVAQCVAALNLANACAAPDFGSACNSIPYALCQNSPLTCSCIAEYTPSTDSTACQVSTFNDRCVEDAQCVGLNADAKCQSERCVCPTNLVQGSTGCVDEVKLGEGCEVDGQCPENSFCDSAVCNCKNYYVKVSENAEDKCLPKAYQVGDACENIDQCQNLRVEGVECTSNQCLCKEGYVESNDKTLCLKSGAQAGDSCAQDQQCPEGLTCDALACAEPTK